MILLIDNYDSFTYNLVQRLGELDSSLDIRVVRNDQITVAPAVALTPSHVIISPGPCTPRESGVSIDIIRAFAGRVPLLGVCLGHQCMGHMHGMTVTRHAVPMHGKTSPVQHDGEGVYLGLPSPFTATRYHSLVITPESVPALESDGSGWKICAWTDEPIDPADPASATRRVVMGVRRIWPAADAHRAPLEGVQYHPESFLTVDGPRLLRNFLNQR